MIGRRQDTDACGNMTPSVHFQEASALVGAKCWRNINVPGPLSKNKVDIYTSISKQVPKITDTVKNERRKGTENLLVLHLPFQTVSTQFG